MPSYQTYTGIERTCTDWAGLVAANTAAVNGDIIRIQGNIIATSAITISKDIKIVSDPGFYWSRATVSSNGMITVSGAVCFENVLIYNGTWNGLTFTSATGRVIMLSTALKFKFSGTVHSGSYFI